MRRQYEALGLETDAFELDRAALSALPAFVDSGLSFAGRPNIIATWRGVGGGRSLILNGHTDVVSPEPLGAWRYDPWGAEVVAGGWPRPHGRPRDAGHEVGADRQSVRRARVDGERRPAAR